jgi:hypothetical protein
MVYAGRWEQQGDEFRHEHSDTFCDYARPSFRWQCIGP